MKRPLFLALPFVLVLSGTVLGHPSWAVVHGNSCAVCHELSPNEGGVQGGGEARLNAMSVLSPATLDPDEAQGTPPDDWQDRGGLKLFTVQPGETIDLTMQVENGAVEYAVQIKRFEREGFSGMGNSLAGHFAPDPNWMAQGFDDTVYYTSSASEDDGYDWSAGSTDPVPFSFSLTLATDAPIDLYDLEFATAGIDPATMNGKWYGDEHFYLNVVPEPYCTAELFSLGFLACCLWMRRNRE